MFNGLSRRTELLQLVARISIIESELTIQRRLRREERHKRHTLEKLGVRKDIPAAK